MRNSFLVIVTLWFISVGAFAQSFEELTLSKTFNGQSVETIKSFLVNPQYTLLSFELKGMVKNDGKIIITLIKPNGDQLKYIEIDATSDVKYEQMLDITKSPDLKGDWQINVKSEEAEGYYKLMIYTK